VKVGVWCAVSARNVVRVFFNETINCGMYLHVEIELSTPPVICEQREKLPLIPNVIGMLGHRRNSRELRGRLCAGSGEAQSRELVNFIKKHCYKYYVSGHYASSCFY
jgi:hypothetical protein